MIACEIRTELLRHMKNIEDLKIKISNAQSTYDPISSENLTLKALQIEEAKRNALNKELINCR
jgi:hypothetical protein